MRQASNQQIYGQNSLRQSQNEGQYSGSSSHSPGFQGKGFQQKKDKTRSNKSKDNSRDRSANQSSFSNQQNISGFSNQDKFTYQNNQQNIQNQNKMRQSKKYQQNTFQQAARQKNYDTKISNRSNNLSQNQLSFDKYSNQNSGIYRSNSNNPNRNNEIVIVEKDTNKKQAKNQKNNSQNNQKITYENKDKIKRANEKNIEFCQSCNQKFGMFLGRFLCNTCKGVFCKKCTNQNDDKKQRSCHSCREDQKEFEGLQQQQEHEKNVIDIAEQNKQKKRQIQKKRKKSDEEGQDLSRNLHRLMDFKKNKGIEQTREMIAKESQEIGVIGRMEENELIMSQNQSRRITQKQLLKGLSRSSIQAKIASFTNSENKNIIPISQDLFCEELNKLDEQMEAYLTDIQERVMKEFEIDQDRWSEILKKFIRQAIDTVKPCSSMIPKDSIDINQHIKIMAIQYQDTSKCKYVNGVVIKKSLANKHMKSQIENPKIIVLAKSLGYLKEDQDFFDVQHEEKSETENNQIILQKIDSVKPQIIFVRKDANHLIIDQLREKGITVVSNVKETAIERITKLTQTLSLPNINLLSKHFGCGKCENFYVEQIQQGHTLNYDQKFIQSNIDLIFLEGCSPSRGCTILLSGPELAELKIVKHALKKMLRLSRIIFLEKEYFDNLNLILSPFAPEDKDGEKTMFLYKKHIERDFLIFKEMTFSKRGERNNEEPEEQTSNIGKIEQDVRIQEINQQKIINNERDVYAYVQQICKPSTMKKVHFYNEDEKFKDIGLGKKLKELLGDSCKKCKRQQDSENQPENDNDCQAYEYQHVRQFYHGEGYVECRTRFKEQDRPIDQLRDIIKELMKKKDLPIYIFCHCIPCKKDIIQNEEMSRQVQEFSFYCFLEQFFYGQDTRSFQNNPDQQNNMNYGSICQDKFHQNSKITFKIGPLSIEFTYHPLQIYSLDLISFKDLPGKITPQENADKFEKSKNELTQHVQECFNFIIESCKELNHWLSLLQENVFNIQGLSSNAIIKNNDYSQHKIIVEAIITYLGLIKTDCQEYQGRVQKLLSQYKYHHEFYLNKVQNLITRRLLDYVFLLKIIYEQTFSEFILNYAPKPKGRQEKINKKEQAYQLNQEIKNRLSSALNFNQQNNFKFQENTKGSIGNQMIKQNSNSNSSLLFRDDFNKKTISSENTKNRLFGSSSSDFIGNDSDFELKRGSETESYQKAQINYDQSLFMDDGDDLKKIPSQLENEDANQSPHDQDFDKLQLNNKVDKLLTFEERLKNNAAFKEIMLMSPSIPMGFDSNCTKINLNDLSTIICQSLLSNEHLYGLQKQGFMGLDQRLVKTQQVWKNSSIYQGLPDKMSVTIQSKDQSQMIDTQVAQRNENTQIIEFDQIQSNTMNQTGQINTQLNKNQSKNTQVMEEFFVFKENQDVLNKQISNKEIETELLRIEQFNFQINFYTFKDPKQAELKMLKGLADQVANTFKVEKPIITSNKVLEEIELLQPADIDINFYRDINNIIVKLIHDFKNIRETQKNVNQVESKIKNYQQSEKYEIYGFWHDKAQISVIIYFPSHFQALRKLYCGSFSSQCEQLYKSSYWGDNTGGKSKSDFYKSSDDKYVMKKISSSEMHMFNTFGLSYFEYMCRAFNQKCPTAIGKILGAFKVSIKPHSEKQQSYYIVMMENLTIGIDPQKQSLKKYDLKGSQRNRYIDLDSKSSNVTRLDTNFLKDRKSLPFCLNYTMSRLLEIAIHNDTSFFSKNKKVDYSLIAWIDEEKKLIRVGIIDYIQNYNLFKKVETTFKKFSQFNVRDPTILDPKNYKDRFKRAMNNYFVGILQDKPCASLFELMNSEQDKEEQDQIKS